MTSLKSVLGKPVRGILHVPHGKNRIAVDVFDNGCLRPFKYGQVFEASFDSNERTMTSSDTGEVRTSVAALLYRGKPFGFVDAANSYTKVLMQLAAKYPQLVVPAVVSTLDAEGRPVIDILLPDAKWFHRALYGQRRR